MKFFKTVLLAAVCLLPATTFAKDGDRINVKVTDILTLSYEVISEADKTAKLTGCSGKATNSDFSVVIPADVNGYTVTTIEGAFYQKRSLTNITLPTTLKIIDQNAFYGCYNLSEITLPEGLEEINAYAFQGCSSISNVTFPSTLKTIGTHAFDACNSITEIILPEGVESIGHQAFTTAHYASSDNKKAITRCIIPSTVTTLGESILEYTDVDELTLKCKTVPYNTFRGDAIKNLKIAGVETIDEGAFWNCIALESITLAPGLKTIGSNAFCGCIALKVIDVPEGVTTIGGYAFDLAGGNYYGQGSLEAAFIPGSITSIGDEVFGNTPINILTLRCPVIPSKAFENCQMVNLALSNVQSISESAFKGCDKLENVNLCAGLTSIGTSAFEGCKSLKEIYVPSSVTSIGVDCFYECYKMKKATIPDNFTELPGGIFASCLMLKDVIIPSKVTSIGDRAFHNCQSLDTISIPDGVTRIGEKAFYNCKSLKEIVLPSQLKSFGDDVFESANSIKKFYALMEDPNVEFWVWNQPFTNTHYYNATLYVPGASLEKYKKTAPWSNFDNIQPLTDFTGINSPVADSTASGSDKAYGLDGRPVGKHHSGISIVRGRKVVQKR